MNNEIKLIENALRKQRDRTASFSDISFLIKKEAQYGTLNTRVIKNIIQ